MATTEQMDDLDFALVEGYGLDLSKCKGGKSEDGTFYPDIFEISGKPYVLRPFKQDGIDNLAASIASLDGNRLGMYEPFNPEVEGSGWFGGTDVPEDWADQIRGILDRAGDKVYVMSLGREPLLPSFRRKSENLPVSEYERLDREFEEKLPRILEGLALLE